MTSREAVKVGVIAGIISAALPSVPTILANRNDPEYMRHVYLMATLAAVAVWVVWNGR